MNMQIVIAVVIARSKMEISSAEKVVSLSRMEWDGRERTHNALDAHGSGVVDGVMVGGRCYVSEAALPVAVAPAAAKQLPPRRRLEPRFAKFASVVALRSSADSSLCAFFTIEFS